MVVFFLLRFSGATLGERVLGCAGDSCVHYSVSEKCFRLHSCCSGVAVRRQSGLLILKKNAFLSVRSFLGPLHGLRENSNNSIVVSMIALSSHVVSCRVAASGVEFLLDLVSLLSCRVFVRLA